jgi:hypothetical protein
MNKEELISNKVVFEVEFDQEVWATMNREKKSMWIDDVIDSINDHARVSGVSNG